MKNAFNNVLTTLAAAFIVATSTHTFAQERELSVEQTALLRQVVGVLDYVGADYSGAVSADGQVLDQGELTEQGDLAREAANLAQRAGLLPDDPVIRDLGVLSARVAAHATPDEIVALCRRVRTSLVEAHHLVLAPASSPSFERGATLYREAGCVTCHAENGDANTDAARRLTPRPANFRDEERAGAISPVRAYNAITFGISRTAMVRFDSLPSADRWSLAFYVLSLRHNDADARAGEALMRSRSFVVPATARDLADVDANTLRERFLTSFPREQQDKLVAYLQRTASFAHDDDGSFALAKQLLGEGLEAYRAGERETAQRLFVSAYLDGVEPHEAGLRARNEALARRIEGAMMRIRESARDNASNSAMSAAVRDAEQLLMQARAGHADATSSFVGSMAIALREGFEAALLIAALLGLVRKRGAAEQTKYVHFGWVLALPAGAITWLLVGKALSGMQRELAEGIISLVAAIVLLGVTHWIAGQISTREFMGFLSKRAGEGLSSGGRRAAFAALGLAFLAAYREVFELVLFYQALLLDAGEHAKMVWLGALTGVAVLVIIVLVLRQVGQKIPPRPFMLVSSILLAFLAIMMVGKGVHSLQEAALIPMNRLSFGDLPTVGFFATREGLIAQAALALLLLTSAIWPWLAARRAAKETPPSPPTASAA